MPEGKELQYILSHVGFVEEEKMLVPGVKVRAACVEKLASLSVECFDVGGPSEDKTEFPRILFLMHQWFVSSEDLATIFLDLYDSCRDCVNVCTDLPCMHINSACPRHSYKARVCQAVRFWIDTFPVHFDLNTKLSEAVSKFKDVIMKQDDNEALTQLVDISKIPSYDWMRNMSVRQSSTRHSTRKVSLVFNNLQPSELAEQFTFLEYKAFRRITFNDFKHYAVHGSLKDNAKLERSIALFNGLSQWVQCMVLCKTTPQQRADVIVKFINIAKRLLELHNFNSLMAVIGGLTHSSLARLTKSNTCLPCGYKKELMDFAELLSSSNNFSNYRRALTQTTGFRIPILGVHLKDLILLNTALPDMFDGNLVNFRKMVQLSFIFTEVMQVQDGSLPFEVNMDLANTLRLSLDLHYTEDEIYELSLAREPRNSLSAPTTPTKPVVFAEWICGVSPPDPETINKHVHDMVEAVFKNYDHDRDGFISQAEFEAIAGNFPFIDSFCVLDADQDGKISKAEMKTYFIRANCHALRKCFKHDFHEITYFKPTFCIHCTGLLWGIIKQGWKCKECNINAHRHCKDLVVMECRSKVHTGCHGRSSSIFNGGHRNVTLASKRKMSQRQKRTRLTCSTQTDELERNSVTNSPKSVHFTNANDDMSPSVSLHEDTGNGGEFYEEPSALYERLLKAEEVSNSVTFQFSLNHV
ncbi:hypothetical protein NP493_161g05024 [Ridgeia piscesae]|uniref:Ras guanyl-releasing protein 3 n=1 Tax=Ridgeia piscesae TaxID=27915 RepID=A0AAD9UFP3_RIDPI|nr:hypothetical protein NP493_161g05024 [Ridgeia piscesae]